MMSSRLQYFKTEITAGLSIFFSVWTITFLYGHVLQGFGCSPSHWFTAICLLACSGCLISCLLIRQPFVIAPGLSIGWFFCHLLTQNQDPKTLFLGVALSGIALIALSQMKLIRNTTQFLPESIQETINIGIGFLFIRIAIEQQFPDLHFSALQNIHTYLFIFTVASLAFYKATRIRLGLLLTVFSTIVLARMFQLTHWQGLFARPSHITTIFSLSQDPIQWLALTKQTLEISLFSLFDTAIGVFCLQQLQMTLKVPMQPALSPSYMSVGLNNIISGILLCGPNTTYIESTIGIQLGARKSLSIFIVACCFAIFLFCFPLGSMIPKELFRGILFFIGGSLITPLYKIRYKTLTANLLSVSMIAIMIWRKSIMDGLIIGIFAMVLQHKLNHTKIEPLIGYSALFSLIILALRLI